MFDIFCLEKWLKWLNEQLFSLESVKKCKKKKKILLTTCRSQKWHSKITYLMLEEWLHRLIKTVWLTDFSCSSVRDCRAKTLQEQKREYKYVEWKLCEANPLCALFIWYCRWKTKKVVLLCIHILVFYCAFKFKSPPITNSMLQIISFTCCALTHLLMPHQHTTEKKSPCQEGMP